MVNGPVVHGALLRNIATELVSVAGSGEIPNKSVALKNVNENVWAKEFDYLHIAKAEYKCRRQRERIFASPQLFGEPAWDMLLDLFIAAGESRVVTVKGACIGAVAPQTTTLRWIDRLERERIVYKELDPADHRRINIKLTSRGYLLMINYLSAGAQGTSAWAVSQLNEDRPGAPRLDQVKGGGRRRGTALAS